VILLSVNTVIPDGKDIMKKGAGIDAVEHGEEKHIQPRCLTLVFENKVSFVT